MLSMFMESVMEDEVDAVVDDAIDNEEVDVGLPAEEDDGIFADNLPGVEYDEEEEYEDPYIVYDVDEEEPSEDDEEDEDYEDEDEDDFFVQESTYYENPVKKLMRLSLNESAFNVAALQMLIEAASEEEQKQKAIQSCKELEAKLNRYKSKGYKNWKRSAEGRKTTDATKATAVVGSLCTIGAAMLFALAGVPLPFVAILAAVDSIFTFGPIAASNALNKAYSRNYSKQDVAKIKHYIKKCREISKELEERADKAENSEKAANLRRTAKDYAKLADKFAKEYDIKKLNDE